MINPTFERLVPPPNWSRDGLPGWTYHNDELLALEREVLFQRHWQLAGHTCDVPQIGDYLTLNAFGERIIIIRGQDQRLRAFHNLCRHRGSVLLKEKRGSCVRVLVCPFHGWSYHLDGSLRTPAKSHTFPPLDWHQHGLVAIELETWQGFIFIRIAPGQQPSVAQILAPFNDLVAPYQLPQLLPGAGDDPWTTELEVNWKTVRDVDNEGYHVAAAHPGLHDLYGDHYHDEPFIDGVSRTIAGFNQGPGKLWSVRHYKQLLPEATWLPEGYRRCWWYIGLFPNSVIGLYPDSITFYQEFPLTAGRTLIRGAVYRRPDEDRRLRLCRYLSGRIDAQASEEDRGLASGIYNACFSSAYGATLLSDLEYGVRTHHDHMRALLPVLGLTAAPPHGTLAETNARLQQSASPAA